MRRALRPICSDHFGEPDQRDKARFWDRIVAARAELEEILSGSDALILSFPRRCVEALLGWFDDVDDGEEVALRCRDEIEERIQTMIDCLDDLDGDTDREVELLEDGADREEEAWAA